MTNSVDEPLTVSEALSGNVPMTHVPDVRVEVEKDGTASFGTIPTRWDCGPCASSGVEKYVPDSCPCCGGAVHTHPTTPS